MKYTVSMLRKLNTILLIPIILLSLVHLVFMTGVLTFVFPFHPAYQYIGYALLILLAIHAAIGIFFTVSRIFKRSRKQKKYRSENKALAGQILTGLVMLVLVFVHMTTYGYTAADGSFIIRPPSLQYFILECLLALTIFAHCVLSIPRLALSLGVVRRPSGLKTVFVGNMIVCFICLVVVLAAYASYYLPAIFGGIP